MDYSVEKLDRSARRVCYYFRDAFSRPELGSYDVENVPGDLCTHAIYSFVGVDDVNWGVLVLNPQVRSILIISVELKNMIEFNFDTD